MELHGVIQADRIAQLSFAVGGMLQTLSVSPGQEVRKSQTVATLSTTLLQSYLDRALKSYDKVRAEFDREMAKETTDVKRRTLQDELDISVENVEIAKANLDETKLICPIDGVVTQIAPQGVVPGVNITPARFSVTVVDLSSLSFHGVVHDRERWTIRTGTQVSVRIESAGKEVKGMITFTEYIPSQDNNYTIHAHLDDSSGLIPGLSATARW